MSQIHGGNSIISFQSAATIPAYVIVRPSGANQVAVWDTATARMIGTSANAVRVTNFPGTTVGVVIAGCGKLTAGASVSAGALITGQTTTGYGIEDATGGFIDTTTAFVPFALGIALDAADTNSTFEVLIQPRHVRFDF